MNKSAIRKKLINLRKKNYIANISLNPNKLFKLIEKQNLSSKVIGCYYPFNYELDILNILEALDNENYILSLPKILKNNEMNFFQWSKSDPLKINSYGIPEPISNKKIDPDILLIPLVGFDSQFNRLGYGGGYYDRYLSKVKLDKKIFKIGVGFSFQGVKNLPINKFDQKLDCIITEKKDYFMKILFLGDVVGISGSSKILNNLKSEIQKKKIDFVIVNGENSAEPGVGLTEDNCKDFFNCGVDVITSGNHVWDQKEIMSFIEKENRLLRPYNLFEPSPGKGFEIYKTSENINIGVLNLMGNVFMKKCDDVFETSKKFLKEHTLKEDYDLLIVDFHGEITSEKNAIGHYFDGKATLVVGTHTHIPTNDARILKNGTAYQTDAGMCGDYDSVIGMNKENSINRFFKENSTKHFPAIGEATLSGVIVECDLKTGLSKHVESYIFGGQLKNTL